MYAGLNITARQYGEVVLPDAASGQGPGTPPEAGIESCHGASLPGCAVRQGGYGALFAVQVQSWLSITSVAVQG
jgi:hypothetical protein